ncbi:hypothetical protein [Polaribacter glomeratus]|uniref:Uncharacterized protein n=1 Tax=Polaribacter glomeratus TaxID=102 RepID=A0A2S7WX52_9FLAO|nr:hypothetical protein [Polaribacter glomeratus]PQJ82180.1 hypothetical protein BTO16_06145 [Polaribacter glomeratus]TXD66774.1 hypothetical protein ESX12_04455 [Polaribacter glomeratus]
MKKLLTICFLISIIVTVKAQKKGIILAESERESCFAYAYAESPVNPNVKILIVSSYVYRKKYKDTDASDKLSNASTNYYGNIINYFNKKLDEITTNERVFVSGVAKDIVFDSNIAESFYSIVKADGYCPITSREQLNMPQHSSTRTFSADCRNRLISSKRAEGYYVFQVEFNEFYEPRDSYGSLWTEEHHKLAVDQVEKLSPLIIDVYIPSLIKNLSNYKSIPASSYKMPGLIVSGESSSDKPANSSPSTLNSSSLSSDATVYNNMFLAEDARKQQEEKAYQDLVKGVFDLFAPSPEKLAREAKEREYLQKMQTEQFNLGQKLIKENFTNALNGDSLSISKTYQGYLKTGSKVTASQFVIKMHEKHRSKATFNLLNSIYKAEEAGFNSVIDLHNFDKRTNRAYVFMILGGTAAAIPLVYKDQIVDKNKIGDPK